MPVITIAGREVTSTQVPHIKADIKAARSVLERLRRPSCYTTTIVKVIDS